MAKLISMFNQDFTTFFNMYETFKSKYYQHQNTFPYNKLLAGC